MTLSDVQIISTIIQNVALTGAGIFTAWWAYSTFGYKEKTEELTAIAKKILEIHSFIETSALQDIVFRLSGLEDLKYQDWKRQIEMRYDSFRAELSNLRDLSFNIPVPFRILRVIEYETALMGYRSLDQWNDTNVKKEMIDLRVKILHDIAEEANVHRNFFIRINVLFKNFVYYLKN